MNIKTTKKNALSIASYLMSEGCVVVIVPVGDWYRVRVDFMVR